MGWKNKFLQKAAERNWWGEIKGGVSVRTSNMQTFVKAVVTQLEEFLIDFWLNTLTIQSTIYSQGTDGLTS